MLEEISNEMRLECDECHYEKLGHWYSDTETLVEWFLCKGCYGPIAVSDSEWYESED